LIKPRLLRRLLLLCLLQLRHLHRGVGVEPRLLETLRGSLQLELRLLACKLALKSRLLRGKLCCGLPKLRLLHARPDRAGACLLQHLRRLLTKTGLLRRCGNVCLARLLLKACCLKTESRLLACHRRL